MNVKNAIEWLRLNNLPDIVVGVDSDRQPPTFSHEIENDEEGDIEATISFFEQNVKLLPPGRYRIVAKKNKKGGAGKRMFRFTVGEDEAPQTRQQGISSIGDIDAHVNSIIEARIAGYEMERKVLDLEREKALLEEALKEKNSWQSQLGFLGEKTAAHIVKKMGWNLPEPDELEPTPIPRPQPQINSPVEGRGEQADDELDSRHEAAIGCLCEKLETSGAVDLVEKISSLSPKALKRIMELDPDILEKVAQVDDSQLQMIKNFL